MALSHSRVFRQCGASFLIGIILSYYFPLQAIFFFAFLIFIYFLGRKKEFIVLILVLSSLFLGTYRYFVVFEELKNTAIVEETQIEINVPIIAEPILKENYQRIIIPITGDISSAQEKKILPLLSCPDNNSRILKVPHHGSRYSSSAQFLEKFKPQIAIIEVGENSYGHSHPDTLERLKDIGAQIFRTDLDGTISFRVK